MAHGRHRHGKGRGIHARDHIIVAQAVGDTLRRFGEELIPGLAPVAFFDGAEFVEFDGKAHGCPGFGDA